MLPVLWDIFFLSIDNSVHFSFFWVDLFLWCTFLCFVYPTGIFCFYIYIYIYISCSLFVTFDFEIDWFIL